jgi:hypothetical protein
MKNNGNYEGLRPFINDFLRRMIAEIEPSVIHETTLSLFSLETAGGRTGFQKLLQEIEITEEQFADQFLTPWRHLPLSQMQKVMNYWNLFIGRPRAVQMSIDRIHEYRALHWTIVNVYNLNMSGLSLFLSNYKELLEQEEPKDTYDHLTQMYIAPEYGLPFQQCRLCGRQDTDPRGRRFSNKLRFCHQGGCPSNPNSSAHDINCCYGQWHQIQKNFFARLKRTNQSPEKIRGCFLGFLESRYQENLKQKWDVRAKELKNKEWQMLYETSSHKVDL